VPAQFPLVLVQFQVPVVGLQLAEGDSVGSNHAVDLLLVDLAQLLATSAVDQTTSLEIARLRP
jgi:hypothetical protein